MVDVTAEYLCRLEPSYHKNGFPTPKWIEFCREMLSRGYRVRLHRSRTTYSKYIYINKGKFVKKVRFSNHRPAYGKEVIGDCDYYVGVGHLGTTTTEKVVEQIELDYKIRKVRRMKR